ncbi:MAG TPA: TetR/AcrR family transcriptional regulator [Chthoniobacterales bacterium]|nr:TetR/AcrR family transcriptional regulator [Chthoniobacterales bacterium]
MPTTTHRAEAQLDRRQQILTASLQSFAECGFHQTSMHDISAKAGISVGLIYRYFKNKDEVIAALAAEHKKAIAALLERAGDAPTLLEAMEIIFTSHCEGSPRMVSAFVIDLFAEASRNPRVAKVVRDVARAKSAGVAALIARSPELKQAAPGLDPRAIAEMIFAVNDGTMMRSVLLPASASAAQQRKHQLEIARALWQLLFKKKTSHANGRN